MLSNQGKRLETIPAQLLSLPSSDSGHWEQAADRSSWSHVITGAV